jgi:hypothetical protein
MHVPDRFEDSEQYYHHRADLVVVLTTPTRLNKCGQHGRNPPENWGIGLWVKRFGLRMKGLRFRV